MSFNNASINESPTIVEIAAAAMTDPAMKAVKYDANGKVVFAGTGEDAIGIVLPCVDGAKAGDRIDIQIKAIGKWLAGGAIAKGAKLAVDADGKATAATYGAHVIGTALEAATAAGDIVLVDLTKEGEALAAANVLKLPANSTIASGAKLAAAASSGKAAVCGTSGALVLGIIAADAPASISADADVPIIVSGIATVVSGAAFSAGEALMSDGSGKAIPATTGKYIIGYALEAASAANKDARIVVAHGLMA